MRNDVERRRRLARHELERLRAALDPTGTEVVATPLLGGLDRAMYRVDVRRPDGTARTFVVRGTRQRVPDGRALIEHEHETLTVVAELTDLAPRPLLLDADGALIGTPSLVMTYIEGAPMPPRDDAQRWIAELVRALAAVHAVRLGGRAGRLEQKGDPVGRARWMCERFRSGDALSQDVIRAVTRVASNVRRNADVFVHGDFWYGNTVWLDGRIVGLVDWFSAGIGDPGMEVASARVDAALVLGLDAAVEIGERYAHVRPSLSDQTFWDALAALPGLTMLRDWVRAYAEVGFVIDEAEARSRLERFVERALSTLP